MLRLVFKTSDTRRLAIRMWWARQDANLQPVGHVSSEPRNTAGTSELQRKQSKNSSGGCFEEVSRTFDAPVRFISNQSEPRKVRSHDRCVYRARKRQTASKLDQLAEKLDQSRSYMAAEAIKAFVEQQERHHY